MMLWLSMMGFYGDMMYQNSDPDRFAHQAQKHFDCINPKCKNKFKTNKYCQVGMGRKPDIVSHCPLCGSEARKGSSSATSTTSLANEFLSAIENMEDDPVIG